MKSFSQLMRWLAVGLLAAAIMQELRKPAAERTWRGQVAGLVPYDLRWPAVDRVRAALWTPDNPDLFIPTPFGVGWSINLAALADTVRKLSSGQ
ncbi:MAG TPA: DUF5808 domain-containing protein [Chloroflexota bacterium]